MGASQALVLERILQGELARGRPGALLRESVATLHRASELSPVVRGEPLPSGVPSLDRLLGGGLPAGGLVELAGRPSSGRFSIGLSALASATSAGQVAALVDPGEHLDPQSAERGGVDLRYLLWVRPLRVKEALATAEMLLGAGFPLVVVDLGLCPRARFVPDAAWLRLARSAQARGSTLLLLTPVRSSGIAAGAVVATDSLRPVWQGSGRTPRLLAGITSRLTLEKQGRMTPGTSASMGLLSPDAFPGRPPGTPNAGERVVRIAPDVHRSRVVPSRGRSPLRLKAESREPTASP